MGWRLPPDEYQRHRVTIELGGPVDKATWARYRSQVRGLIKKYHARLVDQQLGKKGTPKKRK